MNRLGKFQAILAMVGILVISVSHAEDSRQKFSDPTEKSLEAGSVSLIQNDNGSVVEIRVSDCELCDRASYLPRRNLEVEISGEDLRKDEFQKYSGRAGTIVFNQTDHMVLGVYYWGSGFVEDGQ